MFKPRTLKFLGVMIATFVLLAAPALVWPGYLDSPIGLLVALPYVSIYLFHRIGIPGLLEHNGLCGWGWCAPTPLGVAFLIAAWLLIAWVMAWGLASMTGHSGHSR